MDAADIPAAPEPAKQLQFVAQNLTYSMLYVGFWSQHACWLASSVISVQKIV